MPKKTRADKTRASAEYHRAEIRRAYEEDDIIAPLTAAMRWLYAALAQKQRESPGDAHAAYRHATDQIATYADMLQHRTEGR